MPAIEVLRELLARSASSLVANETYPHIYAASGEPTVAVPLARADEIDHAVATARAATTGWRSMRPDLRRDLLVRIGLLVTAHAERLARVATLESGVPLQVSRQFPAFVADSFAYFAGWADKLVGEVVPVWPTAALDYAVPEPYGVIAVLLPWNAPLQVIAQVVAPALAAGNTVVIKPSEKAPFSSLLFAELAREAGLPSGALVVAVSDARGGELLVSHPGIDKIHFTGASASARGVLAAALPNLTPHCLELGGKSALVVFADADLAVAARHAASGAVVLAGQGCTNPTRILVESSVYERVLRLTSGFLRRVTIGDPLDEKVMMGPLQSERACTRVLGVIRHTLEHSQGRLVCGGERLAGVLASGFFCAPTIIAEVSPESELAREETFGPVISFASFDTETDAIELANATRFGLAGYVHTADLRRAHRVASALRTGGVWVNGVEVAPGQPFGGIGQSGYGRVGGVAAMRELTRTKNVWIPT